ncbi:DUF6134 family protein [Novosphingobium terrae]|uniref:DUF6134 family protein n=1 Tax=Novosphingobium terrae TaxID=2726189 RepID=UPI00197E8D7C|nr:DUF6134 family protein [Novosphingobium terrae]
MTGAVIDRRGMLAGAAALTIVPQTLRAALQVPLANRLGFDILRSGKKLGTHILTFEPGNGTLTVRVMVELAFKIAGITLYHYRHEAIERWEGERVVALDTQTDDNGTAHRVTARREGNVLMVEADKLARYAAPADALPATHWNRRELDGPWINTQDGKILRPHVAAQGIESIPAAGGATLHARRYALTGDVKLDMFYDDRQGWAGLSFVKGGAPVRYERQG